MDFSRAAYSSRSYNTVDIPAPKLASVQEQDTVHKIISFFVLLILSPLWIVLSVLTEAMVIPAYMTVNLIKRSQGTNFSLLLCLISPVVLFTFMVFCTFLLVVSFIMKIYGAILAKDTSKALQELVFPEVHPIYENYFKVMTENKVEQEKPKQFASTAETEASYQPPHSSFESDDILFSKAKHCDF